MWRRGRKSDGLSFGPSARHPDGSTSHDELISFVRRKGRVRAWVRGTVVMLAYAGRAKSIWARGLGRVDARQDDKTALQRRISSILCTFALPCPYIVSRPVPHTFYSKQCRARQSKSLTPVLLLRPTRNQTKQSSMPVRPRPSCRTAATRGRKDLTAR